MPSTDTKCGRLYHMQDIQMWLHDGLLALNLKWYLFCVAIMLRNTRDILQFTITRWHEMAQVVEIVHQKRKTCSMQWSMFIKYATRYVNMSCLQIYTQTNLKYRYVYICKSIPKLKKKWLESMKNTRKSCSHKINNFSVHGYLFRMH